MLSIVLSGGGTAGHVNPLVATATELLGRGHTVRAVGTAEGLETDLVPAAGIELSTIERVPFPRRPDLAALRFPVRFRAAVRHAGEILDDAGADVAVGFGGFASTPLYVAAKKRGIPVVIHEQNAKPGLANRYGARFAKGVALTFPSTPLAAVKGETTTVGLPLRRAIADLAVRRAAGETSQARVAAAAELGLDHELPTLLVTGGSLGAQHLNEVILSCASEISAAGVQVLHLTGRGKDTPVRPLEASNPRYHVLDYLSKMELAYAVADVVLCRSGAGTVAELCSLGLPAFFVPLAIGNGEQEKNAADVLAVGGAQLVRNKDFTRKVFVERVLPLVTSGDLERMGEKARELAPQDSAGTLASFIERCAQ